MVVNERYLDLVLDVYLVRSREAFGFFVDAMTLNKLWLANKQTRWKEKTVSYACWKTQLQTLQASLISSVPERWKKDKRWKTYMRSSVGIIQHQTFEERDLRPRSRRASFRILQLMLILDEIPPNTQVDPLAH